MRSLNRPPYYADPTAQTELQTSLMRSGVRFDLWAVGRGHEPQP